MSDGLETNYLGHEDTDFAVRATAKLVGTQILYVLKQ
jgi:hypothetical protein